MRFYTQAKELFRSTVAGLLLILGLAVGMGAQTLPKPAVPPRRQHCRPHKRRTGFRRSRFHPVRISGQDVRSSTALRATGSNTRRRGHPGCSAATANTCGLQNVRRMVADQQ